MYTREPFQSPKGLSLAQIWFRHKNTYDNNLVYIPGKQLYWKTSHTILKPKLSLAQIRFRHKKNAYDNNLIYFPGKQLSWKTSPKILKEKLNLPQSWSHNKNARDIKLALLVSVDFWVNCVGF